MCGIAGIYHVNSHGSISLDVLKAMTATLRHRGPDEAGLYVDDNVGLGHTRLSIIDLSSGTQPIHNEDKSLWIVYNGEVYNYPELGEQLRALGHRFYTTSDTEVLLHLYEEEGNACFDKLNGQFAVAIWDTKNKELLLARDRLGIRPLYYTLAGGKLIFASEIKAIFANPNVARRIDPKAMDQILTFWTTLTPRTVFENVREVPPGCFVKCRNGDMRTEKYWDIPFSVRGEQRQPAGDDLSEHLQQLLTDAARIRLRADVPVACYLSGGLDSSGIASLIVNNYNSSVRTFGIRFEEGAFDEGEHQNLMVSFLNVRHSEIRATNELIGRTFADCIWHCEKPILRTAPVPLLLLSRLVRDSGFKVVLTGEGADEIFGGYNIYREAKVRRFWARQPGSQKRAELIGRLYPYIFNNPRMRHALQAFFAKGLDHCDDPLFSHLVRWENTSRLKTFFSDELRNQLDSYNAYEEVTDRLPASYPQWDGLAKAQYLEMSIFLSNYLLSSQGDRVAMANSVEIRLPYLDPNVIEFMGKVPARWKILGLNEKHLLKKSFSRLLPRQVIDRPKHPYRAPVVQTLLHDNADGAANEMLSEEALRRTGLFDPAKVAKLLRKLRTTGRAGEMDGMALVGILSSQIVYRQFIEDFGGKAGNPIQFKVLFDRRAQAVRNEG